VIFLEMMLALHLLCYLPRTI